MKDRRVIDEIRTRIDIATIVGERVTLKKAGAHYKGLCPFHSEKTPSFTVNPERGLYKCFGCGKSGDIFSFLQETQGLSFGEALRDLAKRAGVKLESRAGDESSPREAILELNNRALQFYLDTLSSPAGAEARKYLTNRGIDAALCERFRIGLAPDSWDAFLRRVEKQYPPEVLRVSGLCREREKGGFYDLFRDRIIFPIFDLSGKAIAFGAREFRGAKDAPKYINSPETPVYVKGHHLYGLNVAKDAIKRNGKALMMEGYTDVMMAHRHGFTNAVASLGTALTNEQVALLTRFGTEIVLTYDADAAGKKAAERGIDIALNRGLSVRVAALPDGLDPADALTKHDASVFARAIERAADFIDHRINEALQNCRTPTERARAAKVLVDSLGTITDRILRATILRTVATRFGIPEASLSEETTPRPTTERSETDLKIGRVARGLDPELSLIRLIIDEPSLRKRAAAELTRADFSKEVRGDVFEAILAADRAGEPLIGDLGGRVEGLGLKLLAHVATADLPGGERPRLYEDFMRAVRVRVIDDEISNCTIALQKPGIESGEREALTERLSRLLKQKGATVGASGRKTENGGKR